jgi:hypothetical protein
MTKAPLPTRPDRKTRTCLLPKFQMLPEATPTAISDLPLNWICDRRSVCWPWELTTSCVHHIIQPPNIGLQPTAADATVGRCG